MIKFNLKVKAYFSLEFLTAKIKKNPYFVKSDIDNQILITFYNKRVSRATNEEQVIQLCNALLEKLFSDIGIKKVFIHCRNGVLNLDTKKNRTIPKINYDLFLECCEKFPKLELIPNGEVNDIETFNFFKSKNINQFMIGRQFARDLLFLEKLKSGNMY